MKVALLSWVLVLFAIVQAFAQASLQASLSEQRVELHNVVRLSYSVDGGQVSEFELPQLSAFRVVAGPSQQSSTQILNGQTSRSLRVSLDVEALQVGTFRIPPATAVIDGKRVKSNSLKIEVVPAQISSKGSADARAEVIVRTRLSKEEVYVGERFRIETELLNRVNIYTYSIVAPLDLSPFRVDAIRRFDAYERQESIAGMPFQSRRIQVFEAFATQPGLYTIPPEVLDINVIDGAARRSFLFSPPTRAVRVSSPPKTIKVKALPQPAPSDFSGAVGTWKFEGDFDRRSDLSTADVLTFRMEVQGRGDASRVQAPQLAWPQGWRSYPINTLSDEVFETDTGMVFRRSYEYIIAPERGGNYTLAPSVSWFDSKSERYETWTADTLRLQVRDVGTANTYQKQGAEAGESEEALGIYRGQPKVVGELWFHQPWYWMLVALAPLLVLIGWGWRVLRKRMENGKQHIALDPLAEGKRRLASARAQVDNPIAFYIELHQALERFAEDRLQLAKSEQTRTNLEAAFAKTGHAARAEAFLRARSLADQGKYGGGTDLEGRLQALDELERVLAS